MKQLYNPIARYRAKRAAQAETDRRYEEARQAVDAWLRAFNKAKQQYYNEGAEEVWKRFNALPEPPVNDEWKIQEQQIRWALETIQNAHQREVEYREELAEQAQEVDVLEREPNLPDVFFGLHDYLQKAPWYIKPPIKKRVEQRMEELAPEVAKILWEQAQEGSRRAYKRLLVVVNEIGERNYAYSPSWDDLVAKLIKNPSLSNFVPRRQRDPGEVRLMAAEALRTESITQAKIVLANCNAYSKTRAEVGDVLTAELAKLVARIHASADYQAFAK